MQGELSLGAAVGLVIWWVKTVCDVDICISHAASECTRKWLRGAGMTGSGLDLHNAASWKAGGTLGSVSKTPYFSLLLPHLTGHIIHTAQNSSPGPCFSPHASTVWLYHLPSAVVLLILRTSTAVSPHSGFYFLQIYLSVTSCSVKIQNKSAISNSFILNATTLPAA